MPQGDEAGTLGKTRRHKMQRQAGREAWRVVEGAPRLQPLGTQRKEFRSAGWGAIFVWHGFGGAEPSGLAVGMGRCGGAGSAAAQQAGR